MTGQSNNLNQYSTWKNLIFKVFSGFYRLPYKLMFIPILVSLWLGEWYPISNFPMYSQFGNLNYLVSITDGRDRPIPLELYLVLKWLQPIFC